MGWGSGDSCVGGGGGGEGAAAGPYDRAASYSSRGCALHTEGGRCSAHRPRCAGARGVGSANPHTRCRGSYSTGNPQRGFNERGLVVKRVFAQVPWAPGLCRGAAGGGLQRAPPPCVPWGLFLSRTESAESKMPLQPNLKLRRPGTWVQMSRGTGGGKRKTVEDVG